MFWVRIVLVFCLCSLAVGYDEDLARVIAFRHLGIGLVKKMPNNEDPMANFKLVKSKSAIKNNALKWAVEHLENLANAQDCDNKVLEAMNVANYVLNTLHDRLEKFVFVEKARDRTRKLFGYFVEKVEDACEKRFEEEYAILRKRLDLSIVGRFIEQVKFRTDEPIDETGDYLVFPGKLELTGETLSNDLYGLTKDISGIGVKLDQDRFRELFTTHMVEPCKHFESIFDAELMVGFDHNRMAVNYLAPKQWVGFRSRHGIDFLAAIFYRRYCSIVSLAQKDAATLNHIFELYANKLKANST